MDKSEAYVRWFDTLTVTDVSIVGGKNASLGEMLCTLGSQGIQVPDGFATTSDAYWAVMKSNGLVDEISATLTR